MVVTRPPRALLLLALIVLLWSGAAGTASAVHLQPPPGGTSPTDWTIRFTFLGPQGEDIPLRVGRNDAGNLVGVGERHIIDRHTQIPHPDHIEGDLQSPIQPCQYQEPDKMRCVGAASERSSNVVVVFTEREDAASGDGRPVEIITAYDTNS